MRLGFAENIILHAGVLAYLLACVWGIGHLIRPRFFRAGWAHRLLGAGAAFLTPILVSGMVVAGTEIFANLFYSLMLLLWAVGGVGVILTWRPGTDALVAFLSPLIVFVILGSAFVALPGGEKSDELGGALGLLHGAGIFLAYACFAIASAAGVMYLVQEASLRGRAFKEVSWRLPSLEASDRIGIVSVTIGVGLLTVAFAVGLLWQRQEGTLGEQWYKDLTVIFGMITWGLYAAVSVLRLVSAVRGRGIAAAYVGAFLLVLATFLGTSFIFSEGHGEFRTVEGKDHHSFLLGEERP